ncbi:hypothetical protein [Natronorubrum daqingense]|uniref:Uncharacterized protein n=1 Tax=Natronorubrum daqingense TaxID=588898 RepID=A0A1N7G224_9EURY|nr:hypothetical protein [Natronorubrum daqingense]APX98645.1 hypothetical protein BB347_18310 [Natronorubrum daqingense]SIS06601.1 hypothetical protein SAMN05421809_3679 [Natronorubrum daqingense]
MSDATTGSSTPREFKIQNAQLVGREYRVTLAYLVEYDITVTAGLEDHQAVEEADLRRFAGDIDPTERDLIHNDVEVLRDIFEDDVDAHEVAEWIDAPSAPSDDTYWDDTRHFDGSADTEAGHDA